MRFPTLGLEERGAVVIGGRIAHQLSGLIVDHRAIWKAVEARDPRGARRALP
jgi:hypothetical protein